VSAVARGSKSSAVQSDAGFVATARQTSRSQRINGRSGAFSWEDRRLPRHAYETAMPCTLDRASGLLLWAVTAGLTALACGQELTSASTGLPGGSLSAPGDQAPSAGGPSGQGDLPGPGSGGPFSPGVGSPGAGGGSSLSPEFGTGGMGGAQFDGVLSPREGLAARLGKHEYRYSVLDVLGVDLSADELDPNVGGLPNDTGDGVFKHYADKQTSTEQHTLAYFEVASSVSKRVDVAALAEKLAVCQDATVDCGAAWTADIGQRLFRRPLDDRESTLYSDVFADALDQGADFDEAARWVVASLLQAPAFLFRFENETLGTPDEERPLTGNELAARLAAFLWVSVPDDELRAAAANGTLETEAGLQAQVARMLADPKAQRFTEAFITDFSRARLAAFDGATDEQRQALHDSIVATFQYHFWDAQRSVAELFTTREFVINPVVAELLGVPPESGTPVGTSASTRLLDVSQLPERVGIMAHPGVIAGMGDREVGSFVNRGKYLLERLLCQNPVAFPMGLEDALEQFNADTTGLNEHEKVAIRKQRVECWGCHAQFEPFAFGFSRFDGAGRYVGEADAAGKPLSLEGWVPIAAEATAPHYSNFAEYMQILATQEEVQRCMTEHFLDFATAHSPDPLVRAHAETVGAQYLASGATLGAMVSAVIGSPIFDSIKVSAPAEDTTAGGGQ